METARGREENKRHEERKNAGSRALREIIIIAVLGAVVTTVFSLFFAILFFRSVSRACVGRRVCVCMCLFYYERRRQLV